MVRESINKSLSRHTYRKRSKTHRATSQYGCIGSFCKQVSINRVLTDRNHVLFVPNRMAISSYSAVPPGAFNSSSPNTTLADVVTRDDMSSPSERVTMGTPAYRASCAVVWPL